MPNSLASLRHPSCEAPVPSVFFLSPLIVNLNHWATGQCWLNDEKAAKEYKETKEEANVKLAATDTADDEVDEQMDAAVFHLFSSLPG